jgi:hypothetical protein
MPTRFRADFNWTTQIEERHGQISVKRRRVELHQSTGAQQSSHHFTTCFVLELVGSLQLQESDIQHRQAMSCQVVLIEEDLWTPQRIHSLPAMENPAGARRSQSKRTCLPFSKQA